MKFYGDRLIVAVDTGYGNIKTANSIFPAGVVASDDRPFFTENLLSYRDRYYIIGGARKEYGNRKVLDEDYYVLTLAAIATELRLQNLVGGRILLAVGLPLTWLQAQKTEYREYLLRNPIVDFCFCGVDYHLEISDVIVFPQGFAAIADRIRNFTGVNIVADIGNGTMNLLRIVNRRVEMTSLVTEACGVKDCSIAMRIALANQYSGASLHDSILEQVIRTGTAELDTDYLQTLTAAARIYVEGLFRRFREYGYDGKTTRLYVTGGGGCLIQNFGRYPPTLVTINSDLHANAKGYEMLAYEAIRKKGGSA